MDAVIVISPSQVKADTAQDDTVFRMQFDATMTSSHAVASRFCREHDELLGLRTGRDLLHNCISPVSQHIDRALTEKDQHGG